MEYEIIDYTPEHRDAVGRLMTYLLSPYVDSNCRYIEWKYEQNPVITRPIIRLATLDGAVVGMRGLFGTKWHGGHLSRPTVVPHADDLVIHPDHRARGLFLPIMEALLSEAAARGYNTAISLCGGFVTQELSKATQWADIGEIEIHEKPSTKSALYTRFPSIGQLRRVAKSWLRRSSVADAGKRLSRLPGDDEIDAVVGRFNLDRTSEWDMSAATADLSPFIAPVSNRLISSWRTEEYLRWRLGNPTRKYRLIWWNSPSGEGAMILSWSNVSANDVKIAAHRTSNDSVFREMLEVVTSVGSLQVEIVANALDENQRQCLSDIGFTKVLTPSRRRRLLIRSTAASTRTGSQPDDGGFLDTTIHDWRIDRLDTMDA